MAEQIDLNDLLSRKDRLKPKDRMAIPPQRMVEQDPLERIANVKEVPYGFTEEGAKLEALRCFQCKKKPCVDRCPVEIDIPAFLQLIVDGDFLASARKIKEKNLLPAICGRVCPQEEQCQLPCILGKSLKDPKKSVSIGYLERFVSDYEREKGEFLIPEIPPKTGKKIAVVGSGPAGLTVAGDLIKIGHDVTVFEGLHKLGGVLVYGIPEFRLPKKIVEAEVNYLSKLGVEFQPNFLVGKTKTIDELFLIGFDAVFVGTGAGLPYFMNIPGENLCGVYSANEYLTRANLMKSYQFPLSDTPILQAKNVAAFGGGNVAMDSARTALRLGAENSYIIYRRSEVEMPARGDEIEHAKEEGVKFLLLQTPKRFIGDENGWIKEIELIKMELGEPDSSGRRRPVPIENSEFTMKIDAAIVAIGNGPNPLISTTTPEIKVSKWGNIIVEKDTQKTSKKGVFAGGDIVLGAATVILAMGEGRKAANAINKYLENGEW